MQTYTDTADVAKAVRAMLRDYFPGHRFGVRTKRFSGGSAVDVRWTDGPAETVVRSFLRPYGRVDRCEVTGEILLGGNRYVHGHRSYSPEARAWADQERDRRFTRASWQGEAEWQGESWRIISRTTFPPSWPEGEPIVGPVE